MSERDGRVGDEGVGVVGRPLPPGDVDTSSARSSILLSMMMLLSEGSGSVMVSGVGRDTSVEAVPLSGTSGRSGCSV